MRRSQLIALFDQDQRKDVIFPDMGREVTPNVVRHISLANRDEGIITYSQLDAANADNAIQAQVAHFERLGQGFEWKLYDYDTPFDLKERLIAYGFMFEEPEAIMVLDIDDAPARLWQPPRHNVRRITNQADISDVVAVEEQVWEKDFSWLDRSLRDGLSNYPERLSIYVAYVEGQAAGAAWTFFGEGSQFASLWGGSTISTWRKRGLYTALLAVRAQEAKARRVRFLAVDAGEMSRPVLEKFGFEMIAYAYPCKWQVKAEQV